MSHIVDELIAERAPGLRRTAAGRLLLHRLLYPLLGYRKAVAMADAVADRSGAEVFAWLSELLRLEIACTGLEHVPRTGPAVVTPNHPAGIADGIAVYDALSPIRKDITFFANRDAIRVAPRLTDMIVPVEWVSTKRDHGRNRETVRHMLTAFRAGRLVVIFPSGRLAQPTLLGLRERPWQPTAFSIAERQGLPVIPMHIRARNSALYYVFCALHRELRDVTLFRELLNKHRQRYRITIGAPFIPDGDPRALAERVRQFVSHELPAGQEHLTDAGRGWQPPIALQTPTPPGVIGEGLGATDRRRDFQAGCQE